VEVDVLARAESVEILRSRVAGLGGADAGLVAAAVGDLPLAVAQAAGYLAATGVTAAGYAALLGGRRRSWTRSGPRRTRDGSA
jgi:hypothetical protein